MKTRHVFNVFTKISLLGEICTWLNYASKRFWERVKYFFECLLTSDYRLFVQHYKFFLKRKRNKRKVVYLTIPKPISGPAASHVTEQSKIPWTISSFIIRLRTFHRSYDPIPISSDNFITFGCLSCILRNLCPKNILSFISL